MVGGFLSNAHAEIMKKIARGEDVSELFYNNSSDMIRYSDYMSYYEKDCQ